MRSWVYVKTVIKVPDDWLYTQRQRAKMTLMCYGSNKLQKKIITSEYTSKVIPANPNWIMDVEEQTHMLKWITCFIS